MSMLIYVCVREREREGESMLLYHTHIQAVQIKLKVAIKLFKKSCFQKTFFFLVNFPRNRSISSPFISSKRPENFNLETFLKHFFYFQRKMEIIMSKFFF